MSSSKVTVKLPEKFDPTRHRQALEQQIEKTYGAGYEVVSINMDKREAYAINRAAMTEIATETDERVFSVKLGANLRKPSDGERAAALFQDQHPGYYLAQFDPHLGKALMMKLSDEEVRARGAVANALSVKPWEVMLQSRRGGGFDIKLPNSYTPSKHDAKLQEVADSVVGQMGWYVETEPTKLVARIIPSEPPTFPSSIGYPFTREVPKFTLKGKDWAKIPLGMKLPEPGKEKGEEFYLDLLNAAHSQVSGVSGGGKALSADTVVITPNGPVANEDLRVGDLVFGANGYPTVVVGLTPWEVGPLYQVRPNEAEPINVSGEHLWRVSSLASRRAHRYARRGDPTRDLEAAKKLRALLSFARPGQAVTKSKLAEQIEPYVSPDLVNLLPKAIETNAWYPLGESLDFLARYVEEAAGAVGVLPPLETVVTTREMADSLDERWCIRVSEPLQYVDADLPVDPYEVGRECGVIPPEYVRASVAQRREVLRGLTDSSEMEGFLSVLPGAEASVVELVRSLGLWAKYVGHGVVSFGDGWVGVPEVALIGEGRYRCVQVEDSQQLFLVEGYTLTHNSVLLNDFIAGVLVRGAELVIVDLPSKAQPLTTRLPVPPSERHPQGWAELGDVRVGDEVFAADRSVTIVTGLSPITDGRVLEMEFADGTTVRANDEHLWPVVSGISSRPLKFGRDGMLREAEKMARGRVKRPARELAAIIGEPVDYTESLLRELRVPFIDINGECYYEAGEFVWAYVNDRLSRLMTTQEIADSLPVTLFSVDSYTGSGAGVEVVAVREVGVQKVRCIRIEHPSHLYLTDHDIPTHNSVDFLWCKPFVRPGGWGCKDMPSAVTSLALVMEEGERRANILAQHKVTKWTELPESYASQFVPIVVIVDELTGLFYPEEEPKQLPKDHPLRLEAQEINLQKALLKKYIKRIAAELRFVGVSLTLSSQVASANTGIDPSLRTNLHNKVLLGAKPTEGNRRLVLSDPERVPTVPPNVQADGVVSKGTGSAEPEGQEPCVFKTYYADVADLEKWLLSRGVKTTSQPEPTPSQIAKYTPSLDDSAETSEPAPRRSPRPKADSKIVECGSCGLPVSPVNGSCGCSA